MTAPTSAHLDRNESPHPGPGKGLHPFPAAVAALSGLSLLVAGTWCLLWPDGFAQLVGFDYSEHFLHDAGAFQVGLGFGLLLALLWRDPVAVTLAAFLLANTVHAVNHAVDLDLGGHAVDGWLLGALSVLLASALWHRLRALGFVVGPVRPATTATWAPFVEQKTVLLTTYRRDGTPVPTPVSIAVDGDRAVVRSFEKAGKTRRLRRNPTVQVTPSTTRGTPTGPAVDAHARRLDGAEAQQAARLLRRKYPLLHTVLVPLSHRVGRAKTGPTVHFELRR
jgi:PPOX class probable F420-dependent enzyme